MSQVTELKAGAAGIEPHHRVNELRSRLGDELNQLSHELTRPAAREERGEGADREAIQRRVHLLGQLIAGLPMIDPTTVWTDRAGYGSTVFVRDLRSGEEAFYTLMVGELIDVDANQVSLASPLGQALLGCRAGDQPAVTTPQGTRKLRVLSVHTLPDSVGLDGEGAPDAA